MRVKPAGAALIGALLSGVPSLLAQAPATAVVDVGRAAEPDNDRLFTWWPYWREQRQKNVGWRIDYVLTSRDLAARSTGAVVQREVGTSDHAPIVATFDLV